MTNCNATSVSIKLASWRLSVFSVRPLPHAFWFSHNNCSLAGCYGEWRAPASVTSPVWRNPIHRNPFLIINQIHKYTQMTHTFFVTYECTKLLCVSPTRFYHDSFSFKENTYPVLNQRHISVDIRTAPFFTGANHARSRFSKLTLPQRTVPERKCVTKIRVRYHDPRWRRQQPVRMFTPRFLLFRIVFHVFDAGYRAIVSYCFYVIPESVIEFDKTAVNWCTKNTEDLGNSSMRSW